MKIQIVDKPSAEAFASDYEFMSLTFVKKGELPTHERRKKDGSTEVRTTDGRIQLKTQLKCLRKEDGVPVGEEQNVYVSLLNQPVDALVAGGRYQLVPPIYLTTWATNEGRAGTSIVAENVVAI